MVQKDDMEEQPHLLVVDDDDRIRTLLKTYLSKHHYRITTAANAARVRRLLKTLEFDAVVLDIMMPGEDGISLTKFIGEISTIPVLLLTAKGEPNERIEGLRAGADDYLSKPFEPEELLLRIAAILRRGRAQGLDGSRVNFGQWCYTPATGQLVGKDGHMALTQSEVQLLSALARRPGEAISREHLSPDTDATDRAVDVQMARLRRKIEDNPRQPLHLQTMRGAGYRLMAQPLADDPS